MELCASQVGLAAYIRDIVNGGEKFDILDDRAYERPLADIRNNKFSGAVIATPCGTFAVSRQGLPGESHGPCAFRGPEGKDPYGLPIFKLRVRNNAGRAL